MSLDYQNQHYQIQHPTVFLDEKSSSKVLNKTVSLIIPVFNEAGHLEKFLEGIDELDLGMIKELIFIDDCSTDNTANILNNYKFKSNTQIKLQTKNQGKGAAIRAGIMLAKGDFIGVQDADFEYNTKDIPRLLQPLVNDQCDVVFGSRYKKNSAQVHRTYHYLVNRILTALSNLMSGLYLTDMETCYKFFKRDIIQNVNLVSDRFGFEPEITAKIARLKLRVFEVPISYFPRNYLQGKKITWKDGIAAFYHILRFNLFSKAGRDYKKTMSNNYIPDHRQLL